MYSPLDEVVISKRTNWTKSSVTYINSISDSTLVNWVMYKSLMMSIPNGKCVLIVIVVKHVLDYGILQICWEWVYIYMWMNIACMCFVVDNIDYKYYKCLFMKHFKWYANMWHTWRNKRMSCLHTAMWHKSAWSLNCNILHLWGEIVESW